MAAFDPVHDVQRGYRRLIRAMSYPGTVEDVSDESGRIAPTPPFNPTAMLLAFMLLDGEVSFWCDSPNREADTRHLSELTYARATEAADAHYLFVLGGDPRGAIEAASEGTLIDPHLGATVILEVGECVQSGRVYGLELSGPGIDGNRRIAVTGSESWIEVRNTKTAEYPLGIEMILIDRTGRLMALPRSTRVRVLGQPDEGASWDM